MKHKWWFNSILILWLVSCSNSIVVKKTKDLSKEGWYKDSIVSLKVIPPDTLNNYSISFLIRNDNTYPYANLFLIASLETDKYKSIDTLEYAMADIEGHWLGSGIWDLKESKLIYKKNHRFKSKIPVKISIQQAVRKSGDILGDELLPGIKTVGIIIEKATPGNND